jgi:hypothetical protein
MLEHLVSTEAHPPGDFIALDDASAEELLAGQTATSSWLEDLGVRPDSQITDPLQVEAARVAFGSLTTGATSSKEALLTIKTPEAVRHLTGMLTAYDWEFVEQAKELRGYAVAQILEETKNPNPNIRLKALQLLGKVTEIGLFTDKVEIKKTELTDSEIDAKIKEKLGKFMGVVDVVDVESKPDADL